jgi:hypothetical protein
MAHSFSKFEITSELVDYVDEKGVSREFLSASDKDRYRLRLIAQLA